MVMVEMRISSRSRSVGKIFKVQLAGSAAMTEHNADANGEEFADELGSLARKHWLAEGQRKLPKFNAKVVDQIFEGLSERSFPLRELLILDQTLYLEKYVFSKVNGDR